ncbi:MAG TPA: hypothetical protein VNL37_00775 [Candidatus Polarisedimenticolia bacterium]|nr:hypothetical protein [Candidatus Polarisedimenticolia bacterium]
MVRLSAPVLAVTVLIAAAVAGGAGPPASPSGAESVSRPGVEAAPDGEAGVPAPPLDPAALDALVGRILYAARPTTVRTRGSGNLAVDLPRGRAVRLMGLSTEQAFLEPSPSDADLLRQFGVRKVPVYKVSREPLAEDFVTAPAWEEMRAEGLRRLRGRWPGLDDDRLLRILTGEPYLGMTLPQAEEAVGGLIFFRDTSSTPSGPEEVWTVGRRSRLAEQRSFMEGRDKGIRAATFEDYLRVKARFVLRFRDGVLVAIDTPPGRR